MKILNFTATEILPALLDKSKTQTIRPAWKKDPEDYLCTIYKAPRFNAGEKVKLMWNQRSKNTEWCSKCLQGDSETMFPNDGCMNCGVGYGYAFKKFLGNAKITEVFEIGTIRTKVDKNWYNILIDGEALIYEEREDLAKRDGFKSAKEMFEWFDRKYDLSSPKNFYVYRWCWL